MESSFFIVQQSDAKQFWIDRKYIFNQADYLQFPCACDVSEQIYSHLLLHIRLGIYKYDYSWEVISGETQAYSGRRNAFNWSSIYLKAPNNLLGLGQPSAYPVYFVDKIKEFGLQLWLGQCSIVNQPLYLDNLLKNKIT